MEILPESTLNSSVVGYNTLSWKPYQGSSSKLNFPDHRYKCRISIDEEKEFASFQDKYEYVSQEHKLIKKVKSRSRGNAMKTINTLLAQTNYTTPNRPFMKLTQQELEEKRAKHFEEVFKEDEDCMLIEQGVIREIENEGEPMAQVSLNAMTGIPIYQTIRIKGYMGRQLLHILIDS
ncbi:hypothetical protein Tco_0966094 [Tanacetum coccineum]